MSLQLSLTAMGLLFLAKPSFELAAILRKMSPFGGAGLDGREVVLADLALRPAAAGDPEAQGRDEAHADALVDHAGILA